MIIPYGGKLTNIFGISVYQWPRYALSPTNKKNKIQIALFSMVYFRGQRLALDISRERERVYIFFPFEIGIQGKIVFWTSVLYLRGKVIFTMYLLQYRDAVFLVMCITRGERTCKFQAAISIRLYHHQHILRWVNLRIQTQNSQANLKGIPRAWIFTLAWVYVEGGKVSFNHQWKTTIMLTYSLHSL